MMSAAIRVLARAAAIQLGEMAASSSTAAGQAVYRRSGVDKGKGRADATLPAEQLRPSSVRTDDSHRGEEIVHQQQELLERDQLRVPESAGAKETSSRLRVIGPSSNDLGHDLEARVSARKSQPHAGPSKLRDLSVESSASRSKSLDQQSSGVSFEKSNPPNGLADQFGVILEEGSQTDETISASASDPKDASQASPSPLPFPTSPDSSSVSKTPSIPADPDAKISASKGNDAVEVSVVPVSPLPEADTPPRPQSVIDPPLAEADQSEEDAPPVLRASTVPSSRIGRLFHYGSLAASLSWGAASESLRRGSGGGSSGSVFMSDANIRRLVASLSRMRGAALKLGQFMSIQDNHMLPPEIERVLQQVQAHANYMPDWQMEKVIATELGNTWADLFSTFDRTPIASASIGQVHRATLASSKTPVAVKIQFPGIADSISSDLSYLTPLLRSSSVLPKGMFLQNTVAVMRRELADECDYIREGSSAERFRGLLANDPFFEVPRVIAEATTPRVLTMEWAEGKPLSRMKGMSQETKDKIGTNILRLCLIELFHFRFMQTDPNLANFLYDSSRDKMTLIDFGASREYSKEFMDGWYTLLTAAIRGDRAVMKSASEEIGYLTGEENDEMVNAHIDSMALVASPFGHSGVYDFSNQTITDSVRQLIPIMLKHRLTPPPPETYSLNRKLSGAFLMLWEDIVSDYQVGLNEAATVDKVDQVAATA